MKKSFIWMSFILGILLICFAFQKQQERKKTIAILTPATHPSLIKIEEAFIRTMLEDKGDEYRFVIYNAQGSKTLMHSEIEEISQKNHALVLTLGTIASRMTKELFDKKRIATPIVFTCVPDPVGFDIAPGSRITGVEEILHIDKALTLLIKSKPSIQSLLLVYNPVDAGAHQSKQDVEDFLKKHNISLVAIEIFQTNEIQLKVAPFMEKADAVLVLKDNTVVSGLDILVKLCNRFQIPLMASDLDSPARGAALAYGVYEEDFGIEAGRKALRILKEGVSPETIAITPILNFALRVNLQAAKKQGLDLTFIETLEYEAVQ